MLQMVHGRTVQLRYFKKSIKNFKIYMYIASSELIKIKVSLVNWSNGLFQIKKCPPLIEEVEIQTFYSCFKDWKTTL